jgi:hypothetical protein
MQYVMGYFFIEISPFIDNLTAVFYPVFLLISQHDNKAKDMDSDS